MAVKDVIRMGHPTLRKVAQKLSKQEIGRPETASLVQDLFDTMMDQGGIGIAAPQINVSKSVAIIQIDPSSGRYAPEENVPMMVFINPEIKVLDKKRTGFWEGCLSVPGLRGFVERPQHILVKFLDDKAQACELEVQGFTATVIQHELDHLFGRLYVDRIEDRKKLMFEEEYLQFHAEDPAPAID